MNFNINVNQLYPNSYHCTLYVQIWVLFSCSSAKLQSNCSCCGSFCCCNSVPTLAEECSSSHFIAVMHKKWATINATMDQVGVQQSWKYSVMEEDEKTFKCLAGHWKKKCVCWENHASPWWDVMSVFSNATGNASMCAKRLENFTLRFAP